MFSYSSSEHLLVEEHLLEEGSLGGIDHAVVLPLEEGRLHLPGLGLLRQPLETLHLLQDQRRKAVHGDLLLVDRGVGMLLLLRIKLRFLVHDGSCETTLVR